LSISPPSDLVLDVARAADPKRVEAAARRLQGIAGDADATSFAALLQPLQNSASSAKPPTARTNPSVAWSAPSAQTKPTADPIDPYRALGTLVLQKAVENMLPSKSSTVFGAGTAGAVWKSALAEQMANAMSAAVFKPGVHPQNAEQRPRALSQALSIES
jgi:peptidoglycan hydrolase FlgJ